MKEARSRGCCAPCQEDSEKNKDFGMLPVTKWQVAFLCDFRIPLME
ncbi:MAG: hypothetical protein H6Q67_2035, partial [Firmicutes bacterium]|nr:hypothetical protein [Bacillota bacterium]